MEEFPALEITVTEKFRALEDVDRRTTQCG
jgi:hypothetical protein